jgi:hypothetical protein
MAEQHIADPEAWVNQQAHADASDDVLPVPRL